ncbi:hypothetical protein [Gluconobacter roseus]|uniref:Uncharacterized protein n=1 Tax=Gluconobacter roseus NBRC 3990 TaxID=1307950 RepID=A0A4Y3M6C6_9PROT|nr:hypothetical protein [Gluconobacter roseus]KXV42686.1 hypothetical protein AD943_11435 [Gluconobacter roseus]GBR49421.1 hypothetical protein AA3990_2508 [Gluconobacter roseus NBRC 3990]GEB04123.1 hypothetical protein GRO01_16990 [Gluconobacter roseus NBRC 3990]GLP92568.1 hypothetical protein GCM10007871_05460 [Gluconobacter roseus NBRC 3990]
MNFTLLTRSMLAAALVSGAVSLAPQAHAADSTTASNCQQNGQNDVIGRLAQREDCLNSRVQNYQKQSQEAQATREKRLQDLKDKYANAPANQKARLQNQITNEQSKLTNMRDQQTQRLQQLRNAPQQQRDRVNNLGNKTRGDVNNFLNGGL